MMPIPRRREEAEEWLRYATEDLETAEILLGPASPKPKQALFHAQQAVEKALKAFPVFHDSPYPMTHSLTVLLDACAGFEDGLRSEMVPAVWLTQFAVRFRYPGEPEEPGVEEARSGLDDAKRACTLIRDRLARRP
jgi:HEPN domain-containing protein